MTITKDTLCRKLAISRRTLCADLNVRLFEKLKPHGYKKTDKRLVGKVRDVVFEYYGLTIDEFEI